MHFILNIPSPPSSHTSPCASLATHSSRLLSPLRWLQSRPQLLLLPKSIAEASSIPRILILVRLLTIPKTSTLIRLLAQRLNTLTLTLTRTRSLILVRALEIPLFAES